jgi:hypothetical protein
VSGISRRRFLEAAGMLPLAASLAPGALARALAAGDDEAFVFFDPHQAAVVREATARLIPGPRDDPLEAGHPGAREANVVRYIDVLLGAFSFSPPRIHAGGPWSDRAGAPTNEMARFVPLSSFEEALWRRRIARLQRTYVRGIRALDRAAGGDFAAASPGRQDRVLARAGAFRDVLFVHAIEGMFAVPEYGGNRGLVAWREISFPGDVQPRGYTPAEVSRSDGLDPVVPDAVLAAAIASFETAARAIVARRLYGR